MRLELLMRKRVKRTLYAVVLGVCVALMAVSLAGCGGSKKPTPDKTGAAASTTTTATPETKSGTPGSGGEADKSGQKNTGTKQKDILGGGKAAADRAAVEKKLLKAKKDAEARKAANRARNQKNANRTQKNGQGDPGEKVLLK